MFTNYKSVDISIMFKRSARYNACPVRGSSPGTGTIAHAPTLLITMNS